MRTYRGDNGRGHARGWLLLFAFWGTAHASTPDVALDMTRIAPSPDFAGVAFGTSVAAGDLDGDGYSDLVLGAAGAVSLYFGSPQGIEEGYTQLLSRQYEYEEFRWDYGQGVATVDCDADGSDELLVAAPGEVGALFAYETDAGGVLAGSETLIEPLQAAADAGDLFGWGLANAGDVDGDGRDDVLVGAPGWSVDVSEHETGAAFLYSVSASGLDVCSEQRIDVPGFESDEGFFIDFGWRTASAGDMDNDGYADIAVTCAGCGIPDCLDCGSVMEWSGGAVADFSADAVHTLSIPDPRTSGSWNYFGVSVSSAGHLDGDAYGDLIVGSSAGAVVFYGSPDGPDPARMDRDGVLELGLFVAAIGDLDADGFDDVLVSGRDSDVVFGGEAGVDQSRSLETPAAEAGNAWGNAVTAVGDFNGDGHIDMALGANYEDGGLGAAYVITPVCTWYLDADGDGYGDPGVSIAGCQDQPGYAPRPDDCDDADASGHGAVWYRDTDGDGYGLKASGGTLACAEPQQASLFWTDCDDHDAARHPEATDSAADGIDQDCDDHDGPWSPDTGDCSDTGDTGDSALETGGDSSDSADSNDTGDTADSAREDSAAERDDPGEELPPDPECGCAAASAPGGSPAWIPGLLALLGLRARRIR